MAHVVQGWTHDPSVVSSVERLLDGSQVELLVIDADGEVKKHFDIYERFLSDDCMIVLDDFIIATGPSEDLGVRDWITRPPMPAWCETWGCTNGRPGSVNISGPWPPLPAKAEAELEG